MRDAALIPFAISSLLLGAALQLLVGRLCTARIKGVLATLACVPAILAVGVALPAVQAGHTLDLSLGNWDGPFALALHVDALSLLFAGMGVVLGGCVLLYSIGYMAHDAAATRFYLTMLLFIGSFVALVSCANMLVLYLCWEAVGLCSFSLVGFWYTNPESVHGARKVLLMTHIAGYGLLAAILVIYHRTGSMLWTDPAVAHAFTGGVFTLMLIALAAKSVQVPLHTWIPDAMAAPTPVSALLHAACYVTAGVYLAARMHTFAPWPQLWSIAMVWLGTITMVVGVMYAMVQTDLKRLLAFSTVSQIGYMILGIGIGTPLAIVAGLLHCLTHGFFKGGLFLCAGAVQHAAGTRNMNELGGLAERMPRTTLCWLAGVSSMMGVPLLSGFVSKWMIYAAALQAGWLVPALIAWIASLGTVFLCVKATSAVFLGPTTPCTEHAEEAAPSMQWGMGLLAAGNVLLGIAPQWAVNYLLLPIVRALGMPDGVQVTWFGLSASAANFSTTGGLVLAVVSLIVGGLIYAFVYTARPVATTSGAALAGGGIFTGGEPLSDQSRLTVADFADIFQHNWRDFFRWSNVDGVYLALANGLIGVARSFGIAVAWMEQHATWLVVAFAAILFVALRWVVPGAQLAGNVLPLDPIEHAPLLVIVSCAIAGAALLIAAMAHAATRRHAPLMLLTAVATIAGLYSADPRLRLVLLECGALLTAALVWRAARTQSARVTYLAVVAVSAGAALVAPLVYDPQQQLWARALVLTGICVKLAAVPLLFWLLRLADELPAVVLGLILAVVDIAAFAELLLNLDEMPSLLAPSGLLVGAAAVTSLCAALLMLAQRSLKRLLVLSTIEDVGFLLLGASAAGWVASAEGRSLALSGALLAASAHALGKALLFTSLAAPEADCALDGKSTGLAVRYPVSSFGFLFGMLTMLGIPPTLGFLGRWRLYSTALDASPWLLAAFLLASMCALGAYVMALARVWGGPPPEPVPRPMGEALAVQGVLVTLVVLLLAAGIWPSVLSQFMGGRL